MTYKLNKDQSAAVAPEFHWIPIDNDTPRGVTLLLISKPAGRMQSGIYTKQDKFFTHWAPCPTFRKD